MTDGWPGDWHSKVPDKKDVPAGERTGASYTNDNGIRCLVGDGKREYLYMEGDIPTNHC